MELLKQWALLALFDRVYEYRDNKVYRRKNGKLVKPSQSSNGYLQYHFSLRHQKSLHVYEHIMKYVFTFGIYDPKYVIAHKNHNKLDNHIENLECITQRQNIMDSMYYKKDHSQKGKSFTRVIYPPDVRRKVKDLRNEGMSFVKIGKQFNMTRQTASKIYSEDVDSVPYYS